MPILPIFTLAVESSMILPSKERFPLLKAIPQFVFLPRSQSRFQQLNCLFRRAGIKIPLAAKLESEQKEKCPNSYKRKFLRTSSPPSTAPNGSAGWLVSLSFMPTINTTRSKMRCAILWTRVELSLAPAER